MNIKSDKPTSLTIEEKDSMTVILFDKGNLEAVYESELEAENARLQREKDLLNRIVDRRNIYISQLEAELSKWHEDKWVTWKPIDKAIQGAE